MAPLAHILLGGEHDAAAPLGIARLIDAQHALRVRAQIRMGLPLRQPAAIEGLGLPRRIVQKMVQALAVGAGHDGAQLDQRLVVLARQEQANQVLTPCGALLVAREQVVEVRTKLVDRLRGGGGRFAGRGHTGPSSPVWPLARSA